MSPGISTKRTSIVVGRHDLRVYTAHNVTTGESISTSDLAVLLRAIAKSYVEGNNPSWLVDNDHTYPSVDLLAEKIEEALV